jgi:signal transduction histidine kinase/DNA-binding response OmpR family regulator
MFNRGEPSIAGKLTWINMLVSGMALLMACAAFIGYDQVTFRRVTILNLSLLARITGSNCNAALLFNDPESAEKTLAALNADPSIVFAAIYTPSGQLFASYARDPGARIAKVDPITPRQQEAYWIAKNEIFMERAVVSDGKVSGIVYLRARAEAIGERLRLYLGISTLVLLVSLLAALVVSSVFQRAVTKPILHLVKIAKVVSRDKNYSLRVAQVRGQGDVTILIDAFDEMMEQIEESEANLQKAHDSLEQRVEERTAELLEAQKKVRAYSESILRAKEDIERASHFKDQFLSTMSHELRTPLNAVLGFSELLCDARFGELNERQQRYLQHISVSGQHLLSLINDILDLSKIEAGRLQLTLEDVPVHLCFAEVSGALQPLMDRKSQKLKQFAEPELCARADGTRFRQILMNLLGNAIKFTPKGGAIELIARQAGEFIRIEVRDSGPGIPEEEKQKIFEAFYRLRQTDKAAEGTGLGLAITRRLVEMHGGQIGVESEPGSGSCFNFTLPSTRAPKDMEEDTSEAESSTRTAVKVLVIDDDPSAAELLESQLQPAGYEVSLCTQPQYAVEAAAALQPAVITLDIVMLPVSGWEVLSNLKADPRTAKIPVAVVTILDQRATGALLGADEYIVKPVERSTLLAVIERCVSLRGNAGDAKTVLLVEDEAATREYIEELLAGRGFAVKTAADADQARACLRESQFWLVILDLNLPRVSGFQLLAEWRGNPRTADVPVFVLTNRDLTPQEREFLRSNTTPWFSKNEASLDALVSRIE